MGKHSDRPEQLMVWDKYSVKNSLLRFFVETYELVMIEINFRS